MKMRIDGDKIMVTCFLCDREAQMGRHIYRIRNVGEWGIHVCDTCVRSNWDGLLPERNKKLLEHLKTENVTPQLDQNGWIQWPNGFLRAGDRP